MIDTLAMADELAKDGIFSRDQAERLARVATTTATENLVTKADLENAKTDLENAIQVTAAELNGAIQLAKSELNGAIQLAKSELDSTLQLNKVSRSALVACMAFSRSALLRCSVPSRSARLSRWPPRLDRWAALRSTQPKGGLRIEWRGPDRHRRPVPHVRVISPSGRNAAAGSP